MKFAFLEKPSRGGHSFFRELDTCKLAIADDSGEEPDQTEDGVLYVDTDGKIQLRSEPMNSITVPLRKPDGSQTATTCDALEFGYLVNVQGMAWEARA
jgi:hypothetical protein